MGFETIAPVTPERTVQLRVVLDARLTGEEPDAWTYSIAYRRWIRLSNGELAELSGDGETVATTAEKVSLRDFMVKYVGVSDAKISQE